MAIRKKIGIVISDGVGFRNFILSDFIAEAQHTFDEVTIFSCLPSSVYTPYNLNCKVIEIEPFVEKGFTWVFRKTKEIAHLQKFAEGNFGIRDNLNSNYTTAKNIRGYLTRFIFLLTNFLHSERWINFFNYCQQLTFRFYPIVKKYRTQLDNNPVDILFFTHQRPPFIAPLIHIAHQLKIKTASFIFSWDNLASKGRMSGVFSHYLVWSELMKTELMEFYESVNEDQIQVVGTPQFEPYVLPRYELTKEVWAETLKVKIHQQTICFSCGDISTSKNDELYISTIAEAILQKKIPAQVNLIVRTSPAESAERFFALKEKYPFIVWNFPKWELVRKNHPEPWSQRIPLQSDLKELRAMLMYSDVSINMCSTMSLDFMLFDKPVINPVFGNKQNGLYDDQRFLKYAHYDRVATSGSVIIALNESQLISAINESLSDSSLRSAFRTQLLDLQIGKPLIGTSARIINTLHQII